MIYTDSSPSQRSITTHNKIIIDHFHLSPLVHLFFPERRIVSERGKEKNLILGAILAKRIRGASFPSLLRHFFDM